MMEGLEKGDPAEFARELTRSIRASALQTKVVTENIENVQRHYPQFVHDINLYTIQSAKLRDAGDQFAKSLEQYAQSESPALRSGLDVIANCFSAVEDHREALVTRLENKVVVPFSVYETRCKQVKTDAEQPNLAQQKEKIKHRSFDRVKNKSAQHPRYIRAEAKYRKASDEANRSRQILRDQVSDFEREKIRDLKSVFGEFLMSEMLFFSKSLELCTHAYQQLMEVDEDEAINQLDDSMSGVESYGMTGGGKNDEEEEDEEEEEEVEEVEEVSYPPSPRRRMAQD